jgi:hypothetical protein
VVPTPLLVLQLRLQPHQLLLCPRNLTLCAFWNGSGV